MAGEAPDLLTRLGQTPPGQVALLVAATALFLPAPDLDQFALRLLHHRSILTHSVLPAVLVWWLARDLGPAAASGAFLGVAIHLSADLLSPMRGYGAIWLPEPFQHSLGRWSALWLLVNALGAAVLAVAILPDGGHWRLLAAVVGGGAALAYGALNERSALAAAVCLLTVAAGQGAHRWLHP